MRWLLAAMRDGSSAQLLRLEMARRMMPSFIMAYCASRAMSICGGWLVLPMRDCCALSLARRRAGNGMTMTISSRLAHGHSRAASSHFPCPLRALIAEMNANAIPARRARRAGPRVRDYRRIRYYRTFSAQVRDMR